MAPHWGKWVRRDIHSLPPQYEELMKPSVDTESVPTANGSNEAVTGIRATADAKRADETKVTDTPTEEIEIEAAEESALSLPSVQSLPSLPSPPAPAGPPPLPAARNGKTS